MKTTTYAGLGLTLAALALLLAPGRVTAQAPGRGGRGNFTAPPRDWSQDMQMKIT
jgi:hypothetical protein